MMPKDGGFERRIVNKLNKAKSDKTQYHAYRRKQSRFASQDIDILVDSQHDKYYSGIECKSKKIDYEQDATSEAKLYFSEAFSTNKDGKHQIPRISNFLQKTGRNGYLALAYRRGRGRKVLEYMLNWEHVKRVYNEGKSGIPKQLVEKYGTRIDKNYSKISQRMVEYSKEH